MTSKQNYKSKQAGFTLFEIAFVLVVIAILSSPVIGRFIQGRGTATSKTDAENLMQIAANASDKWSNKADYSGTTEATMLNLNVFPTDMVVGTVIKNKARGTVTCLAVDLTGDKDGLECSSTNYPKTDCTTVVQRIDSSMRKITVGAIIVKDIDKELDMAKLGNACVSTGTNIIKFAFGK